MTGAVKLLKTQKPQGATKTREGAAKPLVRQKQHPGAANHGSSRLTGAVELLEPQDYTSGAVKLQELQGHISGAVKIRKPQECIKGAVKLREP